MGEWCPAPLVDAAAKKRDFPEVADDSDWKVPLEAGEKHGEKDPGAQKCRRWEEAS